MGIYGIGTDIVEIARIAAALQRHGDRFAVRVLSDDELPHWRASSNPTSFLAKRFAAKEAFAKALGTGLRGNVTLRRIVIGHDELGRPRFACDPELQDELTARGISSSHLSLSDERHYVVAFVVMET